MQTNDPGYTVEKILRHRWQELKECQQQAEADERQMALTVLLPQPGALPLAGDLSLTELNDFVPSGVGLVGQYEEALHRFAVMSFRWSVRNLMAAAQTVDKGLRDTHRELANWYAERSAELTRELQQFRRVASQLQPDSDGAANQPVELSALIGSTVALGKLSPLATMSVLAAPATEPEQDTHGSRAMTPPESFAAEEPVPMPQLQPQPEPVRTVLLPARCRRKW